MKHFGLYFPFLLAALILFHAQNGFSQDVDASGQWTYVIDSQTADCFPFPAFSDAGTYLISQVGNGVTLVNETYEKSYFGSAVDEGSRIKYEVESSYGYFGGTMSEAFIFYINKTPVDNQTVADGTVSWQWDDLSGNASCQTVNGSYSFSITKHLRQGACYEDFGTKYCCTVDNSGTEYCCHVGEHYIILPQDQKGSPELEHCCSYNDSVSLEYCTYVIDDTMYKWNYEDSGGGTAIKVCPTPSPTSLFPGLCTNSGAWGSTGALSGQVTTTDGQDVTAIVSTYYTSGTIYKTTQTYGSGSSKDYFFGSLSTDNLYLKVAAPGYNNFSSSITISSGETLVVNVSLTPLVQDACPDDPYKDAPGICGCGVPESDSDNDSTPDCHDLCPNDPNKTKPGCNMCGTPDTDRDNDGTVDCLDKCMSDPAKIYPGVCGCGYSDADTDGDGKPDCPIRIGPNIYLLLDKTK